MFPSESQALNHIHDAHKGRLEALLWTLIQGPSDGAFLIPQQPAAVMLADMEQDHLSFFFTKLLYSDLLPPTSGFANTRISPEFPSVLAPELAFQHIKDKVSPPLPLDRLTWEEPVSQCAHHIYTVCLAAF